MSLKTTHRCKKKLKKINISSTNGRKCFSDAIRIIYVNQNSQFVYLCTSCHEFKQDGLVTICTVKGER